jgi:hypothetical protein
VEARSQGPRGHSLGGVKAMRGSACGLRVTPEPSGTDLPGASILGAATAVRPVFGNSFPRVVTPVGKRHEGQARREAWRLLGGEIL